MPKTGALAALDRVEAAQAELRAALQGVAPERLAARPPSGEWSPMEHVRHLLFAQQHHVGPLLPKRFRWSSAGVPPPNRTGERRLSPVGSEPGTSIDEVFEAWAKINDVVRGLCGGTADHVLALTLEGNRRHVRVHVEAIERLLRVGA